jgi:hypothetical protein
VSSLKQLHQEHWRAYQDLQSEAVPDLQNGRSDNNYFIYSMGVSGCHIAASILTKKEKANFYLLLQGEGREKRYHHFCSQKAKILAELGEPPTWELLDNSNCARTTVELADTNPFDQGDWPRQHGWILQHAQSFDEALGTRLQDRKGAK